MLTLFTDVAVGLLTAATATTALAELRSVIVGLLCLPSSRQPTAPSARTPLPRVVVQLPVFKEHLVLKRLLSAVLELDYPKERLSIQVLDDTPGEEARAVEQLVENARTGKLGIQYLHRDDRTGFKAGALNLGLRETAADLLVVFDADFVPVKHFLTSLVGYFDDPRVACVQARWEHSNANYSALTLLQAAIFDNMFLCEEELRARQGTPALFLGTAGIWRRSAVLELGGWREIPFTSEDIDLTLRAHARGYAIAYEPACLSEGESVVSFVGYKGQQRRWARGVLRSAVDNAKTLFSSPFGWRATLIEFSLLFLQLLAAMRPLLVVLLLLCTGLVVPKLTPGWYPLVAVLTVSLLFSPTVFNLIVIQKKLYANWWSRVVLLFRSAHYLCGLGLSIGLGFCDTFLGLNQEFNRTAKQADTRVGARRKPAATAKGGALGEALFTGLSLAGLALALVRGLYETLPLWVFFSLGFGRCWLETWHELDEARNGRANAPLGTGHVRDFR